MLDELYKKLSFDKSVVRNCDILLTFQMLNNYYTKESTAIVEGFIQHLLHAPLFCLNENIVHKPNLKCKHITGNKTFSITGNFLPEEEISTNLLKR